MAHRFHFIAGLPRSGSTLLSAILRQNPAFHAGITTPLASLYETLLHLMSHNDASGLMNDTQRRAILRSLVESYYAHLTEKRVIFDTNRAWCQLLPSLSALFPEARIICCVRSPAWILDSTERLFQRNAFRFSRMFKTEDNVYLRAEVLGQKFVGQALASLRQAWYGDQADRLIAIRYDSLVREPKKILGQLYDALGEPRFAHDFEHVEYEETDYDERSAMPGLHKISGRVEPKERKPILPPDIFNANDKCFWEMPGQNPRGVILW